MALKKEVYRRQATGEALWSTTKKKLQNSTDFVKTQQSELFQIFKNYKTGTKVVAISVVFGVFLFFIFSMAGSLHSISEKQQKLDELDRQIKLQQEANEEIEMLLQGDMDEVMERLAREKLEMVYPDEEIYINNAR